MERLRKKGADVQPVRLTGRKIASTFWGEAWCEHLESFSDYENRLPRGRTYVRNGSVCHLAIQKGKIEAKVSGSSLYTVKIDIRTLPPAKWKSLKARCAGQVGSLLELLQGKLSDRVMTIVTDRDEGLFPSPKEIQLSCSCPDWATMCKHVAAVLYGVGARLDEQAGTPIRASRRRPSGIDLERRGQGGRLQGLAHQRPHPGRSEPGRCVRYRHRAGRTGRGRQACEKAAGQTRGCDRGGRACRGEATSFEQVQEGRYTRTRTRSPGVSLRSEQVAPNQTQATIQGDVLTK